MADFDIDMADAGDDIVLEFDDQSKAEAQHSEHGMRLDDGNGESTLQDVDDRLPAAYTSEHFPIPEMVNVQGVSQFKPDDPKTYALEHFPNEEPLRVHWVNDNSLNLQYSSAAVATSALLALTSPEVGDATAIDPETSRKAKPFSLQPGAELIVREANEGDQKKKNARLQSGFYLRNPQYMRERKPRYRDRDADDDGDYNRRKFDDREHDRRRYNNEGGFDESMYDDAPGPSSPADSRSGSRSYRRDSRHGSEEDDGARRNRNDRYRPRRRDERLEEVFAGRESNYGRLRDDRREATPGKESNYGRLRDRSASPRGDGDGRMGFDEDTSVRRRIRQRSSSTDRRSYRNRRSPASTPRELFGGNQGGNAPREVFGSKSTSGILSSSNEPRELFGSPDQPRELFAPSPRSPFPHKTEHSNHRRTDAQDENHNLRQPKSLFDRITKDGEPVVKRPLEERITRDDDGLKIRGAAKDQGFSIRGAANGDDVKIRGRGNRKLASDLWH